MTFAEKMKGLAKKAGKTLVLAEGLEKRTLKAARIIMNEKIASSVTLVGPVDKVRAAAEAEGVSLEGIRIEDPATDEKKAEFAKEYYELRKHKGMTEEQAAIDIVDQLRWGAMLVHLGYADSMVAGAESTTANVLRAAFNIIKCKPGIKSASSCFVMATDKTQYGVNGSFQPSSLPRSQKPVPKAAAHSLKPNRWWPCSAIQQKVLQRVISSKKCRQRQSSFRRNVLTSRLTESSSLMLQSYRQSQHRRLPVQQSQVMQTHSSSLISRPATSVTSLYSALQVPKLTARFFRVSQSRSVIFHVAVLLRTLSSQPPSLLHRLLQTTDSHIVSDFNPWVLSGIFISLIYKLDNSAFMRDR